MLEINGMHLLIAAAGLFVFIAVRSVQWMPIVVRWREAFFAKKKGLGVIIT